MPGSLLHRATRLLLTVSLKPPHVCVIVLTPVYGPIAEIKLHKKGGYGFVKYDLHESAVQAIVGSHGRLLHGRVSI